MCVHHRTSSNCRPRNKDNDNNYDYDDADELVCWCTASNHETGGINFTLTSEKFAFVARKIKLNASKPVKSRLMLMLLSDASVQFNGFFGQISSKWRMFPMLPYSRMIRAAVVFDGQSEAEQLTDTNYIPIVQINWYHPIKSMHTLVYRKCKLVRYFIYCWAMNV